MPLPPDFVTQPTVETGSSELAKGVPTPTPARFTGTEPTPSPTPMGESIFFVTKDRGNWVLMAIGPDGSGLRAFSDPNSSAWGLTASLDGKVIGYSSNRGGSIEFWVSEPSGANARALSHGGETEISPDPASSPRGSFSPDGLSAAWVERGELWLGDLSGLNPETLASHLPDGKIVSSWFSPGGWEVAYHLSRGTEDLGIWTVPLAGRKPVQRVATALRVPFLAWHPLGRQFIFWREGPMTHTLDIGDKVLAKEDAKTGQFAGNRDGTGMVYIKTEAGAPPPGKLIYIPLGKDPVTLVESGASFPTFSPDGKIVAFRMEGDLWTIGIDGSGRRRLTVVGAWAPLWAASPSGKAPPAPKGGPKKIEKPYPGAKGKALR